MVLKWSEYSSKSLALLLFLLYIAKYMGSYFDIISHKLINNSKYQMLSPNE